MTDLLLLAERVEAAEGPDRELDEAIQTAVASRPTGKRYDYTASLDSAMTLVPEGWTAWQLHSRGRKTRFVASLSRLVDDIDAEFDEEEITRHAATPALALTAACLRAISQGEKA